MFGLIKIKEIGLNVSNLKVLAYVARNILKWIKFCITVY